MTGARLAVLLSAGVLGASALPAAQAAAPTAHAAATCHLSSKDQRGLGPSYVTSLSVTKTSCATGKSVVRAYYHCRVSNGGVKGTCHKRVLGYSCSERRQGIRVQFDATVHCRNGAKIVNHSYTQNT